MKGSRDPLGLVPVWTRFGRHVVGNLSTVSNSTRGFTTLLLGYYFADLIRERDGSASPSTLDLFLKFEQLAGYIRLHLNDDHGFRGIERVGKTLASGSKVTISAAADYQILSNQRVYGLWGLFSVPARTSGLLERDELRLTAEARQFVEKNYMPALNAHGVRGERLLVELLRQSRVRFDLDGPHSGVAHAIAKLLDVRYSDDERRLYNLHLVEGGPADSTRGRQRQLAQLLANTPTGPIGSAQLRGIIKEGQHRGSDWAELVQRLQAIEHIESLLVPAAEAFGFLLTRNGQRVDAVAVDIKKTWGARLNHIDQNAIAAQLPELIASFRDAPCGTRFVNLATAFRTGAYEDAVRLLLEHNAFLMQTRNGSAPWVHLEGERLSVRFRDETNELTPASALARAWRNTYFIDSLKTVSLEIAKGQRG